jgi:hypothetical protein
VQQLIKNQVNGVDLVADLDSGGHLYVCGGTTMGADVMEAVSDLDAVGFPNDNYTFRTLVNDAHTRNTSFIQLVQLTSHATYINEVLHTVVSLSVSSESSVSRFEQNLNYCHREILCKCSRLLHSSVFI